MSENPDVADTVPSVNDGEAEIPLEDKYDDDNDEKPLMCVCTPELACACFA